MSLGHTRRENSEEDEVREVNRAQVTCSQEGHGEESGLYSKSLKGFTRGGDINIENVLSSRVESGDSLAGIDAETAVESLLCESRVGLKTAGRWPARLGCRPDRVLGRGDRRHGG